MMVKKLSGSAWGKSSACLVLAMLAISSVVSSTRAQQNTATQPVETASSSIQKPLSDEERTTRAATVHQQHLEHGVPGSIDGFLTPERIPDDAAYSLLFRMIGNDQVEAGRVTKWATSVGLLGSADTKTHPAIGLAPGEFEQVRKVAANYHRAVSALEAQRRAISSAEVKRATHTTFVDARRDQLAASRLQLAKNVESQLMERLDVFVQTRFKRSLKIVPQQQ